MKKIDLKIGLKKFSKDQIQKMLLSGIGFFILLYVYFSFFLGPLNRSHDSMLVTIADLQNKMGNSKNELLKVKNLERQASAATERFAALQALSPEGAPIAWFPPRIKGFFANQNIDKANARLDTSVAFPQPELSEWVNDSWTIEIPETDFATVGTAIAKLENTEPLITVKKLTFRASAAEPQYQQVTMALATTLVKR
jgi:hypothetical protein